jgi:UDP-4-amino-4,6-dideoxy-N-acetyl-beta-L-altrosamine N-acetyltransferase
MINDITLKNFIHCTDVEKLIVLEWRNNENIKKWMHTTEDISLENHLIFLESLKRDKSRLYFIVKRGVENIGVIDLTNINSDFANIGVYSNPYLFGMGNFLMNQLIYYAFEKLNLNKIKLEVFSDNIKAIKLYDRFNFQETKRKIVSDKEIICMELQNENR